MANKKSIIGTISLPHPSAMIYLPARLPIQHDRRRCSAPKGGNPASPLLSKPKERHNYQQVRPIDNIKGLRNI
jgi:hypothetical protein